MPEPITPHVAGNVRAELARARMSGRELARQLDMTAQSVSVRLMGRVPFDVDLLARVAAVLDVPIEQLIAVPAEQPAEVAS